MIEGETRGEETHGHNKKPEMEYGTTKGGFTRGGFGVSACLQSCKLETLGNSGGFDRQLVSEAKALNVDRDTRHTSLGYILVWAPNDRPRG
jgi:hypothetical protein